MMNGNAIAMGFAALIFGAVVWSEFIAPRMIPRHEVDRLADNLLQRHGTDAERIAAINRQRAHDWDCDAVAARRWLLVLRRLEDMRAAGRE